MFQLTLDRNKNSLNLNLSLNVTQKWKMIFVKAVWKKKEIQNNTLCKQICENESKKYYWKQQSNITIIQAFERKDFEHNI